MMLVFNGCRFYKQVPLNANLSHAWDEGLQTIGEYEGTRIEIINNGHHYLLQDYQTNGNTIKGELKKTDNFTIPDKASFMRLKIPFPERKSFRNTLFVWSENALPEGEFTIKAEDVKMMRFAADSEKSTLVSATIVVGVIGGIAGGLAIACSCPRVYAIDTNGGQVLQGSLFSGAISKSFEREDLLPLPNPDLSGEEIVLRVANELPEDEHINELKLLRFSHQKGYEVANDASGELIEFSNLIAPDFATSSDGEDILSSIKDRDDQAYIFDEETIQGEFSSAILTFDKSQLKSSNPKLVIHGFQTKWLEQVAESFFMLQGTNFDRMNKRMDRVPRQLYDRNMARLGISMNAYVMTRKGWQKIGSYKNAGTTVKKLLSMDLPLDQIEGSQIRIKLEAAFRLWEIDQVGLTNNWNSLNLPEEVPLISAVNQSGEDVSSLIKASDKDYLVQPTEGTYVDLHFKNNAKEGDILVLKGSGYYYHRKTYTHAPEKKAIRAIRSQGKLAAQEFSKLMDQYYQTTALKRP